MRSCSRYFPILSESYEQALHDTRQNSVCRVYEIVLNILCTKKEVVKALSAWNERRTYDERDVTHGDERTESNEELREGGPFPVAAKLVNVGVVGGL